MHCGVKSKFLYLKEAISLGRGGLKRMHELTGLSRPTILKGMEELKSDQNLLKTADGKMRREGGGRKRLVDIDPALVKNLTRIMDENTAGDPMSLLKWTGKSTRKIAGEMANLGHPMSAMSICRMLKEMGYSLQANVKTKEGKEPPDRDAKVLSILMSKLRTSLKIKPPLFQWIQRKKKMLVSSKMQDKPGERKTKRERFCHMTFLIWVLAKQFLTEHMMYRETMAW
jgi:hypothetical protein